MGRRNDHSREEIKDMALQAGIELLETEGFSGLSARKIAARIKYTVGTLYLVFENLDDLILHINLLTLKMMHDGIQGCLDPELGPDEQLKKMAIEYIKFAEQHENRWRMVYEHASELRTPTFDEYTRITLNMLSLVENELKKLQQADQGLLEKQARALWGGVHGICMLSLSGKLHHGDVPIHDMTDLLVDQFIHGMAVQP
jgi:AcrR family transcriptional regulator